MMTLTRAERLVKVTKFSQELFDDRRFSAAAIIFASYYCMLTEHSHKYLINDYV